MKPVNNQYLSQTLISIRNMESANEFIYDNLNKVEGVTHVNPGNKDDQVLIEFDPTRIDPSQIRNLLEQAGFSVKRIE